MQATYSICICQVLFVVKDLRWAVADWFVDICRIVDNHCLNFLFIWFCIILYWNVIHFVLFSGNKIFNKIFFPEEYVDQQFFDKYILWNLLGTNFYAKNRQVFGLYRLNQQRFGRVNSFCSTSDTHHKLCNFRITVKPVYKLNPNKPVSM
jgi:hypothetical protein